MTKPRINAVAAATSPWVNDLRIAEINAASLEEMRNSRSSLRPDCDAG
jgi:hypothetical protein